MVDKCKYCGSKSVAMYADMCGNCYRKVPLVRDLVAICALIKDDQPETVEVIRCRKCVYANDNATICRYGAGKFTSPDHYCSEGELKPRKRG